LDGLVTAGLPDGAGDGIEFGCVAAGRAGAG